MNNDERWLGERVAFHFAVNCKWSDADVDRLIAEGAAGFDPPLDVANVRAAFLERLQESGARAIPMVVVGEAPWERVRRESDAEEAARRLVPVRDGDVRRPRNPLTGVSDEPGLVEVEEPPPPDYGSVDAAIDYSSLGAFPRRVKPAKRPRKKAA
jgi:hypothetical protein